MSMKLIIIGIIFFIIVSIYILYQKYKGYYYEQYFIELDRIRNSIPLQKLFVNTNQMIKYVLENNVARYKDSPIIVMIRFKNINLEFNIGFRIDNFRDQVPNLLKRTDANVYFYDNNEKVWGCLNYSNKDIKINRRNIEFLRIIEYKISLLNTYKYDIELKDFQFRPDGMGIEIYINYQY